MVYYLNIRFVIIEYLVNEKKNNYYWEYRELRGIGKLSPKDAEKEVKRRRKDKQNLCQ